MVTGLPRISACEKCAKWEMALALLADVQSSFMEVGVSGFRV